MSHKDPDSERAEEFARESESGQTGLIREFFIEHRAHTPLFTELPREFVMYLDARGERPGDPPFLLELAHYESVGLALKIDAQDLDALAVDREGDLLGGIPVLSPLVRPLTYRFPVHRIRPDFRPDTAPEAATHLLVYRNRAHRVRYLQLNAVSALLVRGLADHPDRTGRGLLEWLATELGHPRPEAILEHGAGVLQDLHQRDVLLGVRAAPEET